jgi:glycosyltransferase involved in cell wall biosynthesis
VGPRADPITLVGGLSDWNDRRMFHTVHQILVSRELGGAGLIALHLADYMRRQGNTSTVWIPGAGKAWTEAAKLGLHPRPYNAAGALTRGRIRAALANWRLSRQLRKAGGGLVHVHAPLFYGALRKGLSWARVQRVAHVHLEEGVETLRWAFREPPELVVTCARFLVDLARRSLPPGAKTRIVAVPNAVDTLRFCPGAREETRRRLGAPCNRPLVLMLANLAPHKGQETVIRAVARLRQRGLDCTCWLAGIERNGGVDYTKKLNDLVRELGVGDLVCLLGQRDDAPELLRAADCFLLPSTQEGLPLSVLEAQASGTPVLAAPTAGIPEVIRDGETGFLIPAADVESYAERIALVLRDVELRRRVTDAAMDRTRREHSWPVYLQHIDELYAELLEGGRPASQARNCRDIRYGKGPHVAPCA